MFVWTSEKCISPSSSTYRKVDPDRRDVQEKWAKKYVFFFLERKINLIIEN